MTESLAPGVAEDPPGAAGGGRHAHGVLLHPAPEDRHRWGICAAASAGGKVKPGFWEGGEGVREGRRGRRGKEEEGGGRRRKEGEGGGRRRGKEGGLGWCCGVELAGALRWYVGSWRAGFVSVYFVSWMQAEKVKRQPARSKHATHWRTLDFAWTQAS